MNCPRCGSERLFRFEPSRKVKPSTEVKLPVVCRSCGMTTVDGKAMPLPPDVEKAAKSLAVAAADAGEVARAAIMANPDARIAKYFANVYETGFLDGFLRAAAYFQHNAKEGRLVRMRELWRMITFRRIRSVAIRQATTTREDISVSAEMCDQVYTELERLLNPGEPHGTSSENQHQARQERPAHMP